MLNSLNLNLNLKALTARSVPPTNDGCGNLQTISEMSTTLVTTSGYTNL